VVNPHEDGASLDSIMDWVASAGVPLERLSDYDVWLERFRGELEALPEAARRASALPVLHQWARQGDGRQGPPLDATRMRRALRELTPWDDLPALTEAFIHTCLASMAALGLIDALPERRGGGADAHTGAAAP
jgi:fatty acid CoA ligase FadD9